ncbi:LuxR C-terminal-related transcriptional regulator [Actinoplanes sp. NPDC049548]|uniref:LuxR C-terminal-related transcriptional regulator n=1 Tax=Actinoplanes sp. NPDC049548 TaxID=3155152 RepID=UPI003421DB38
MVSPARARQALGAVAGIASMAGSVTDRAEALVEPLRQITPFDAVFLTLFDPERRLQVPVLRQGYPEPASRGLDGEQFTRDVELAGMHGPSGPVRAGDLPVPVETLPTWSQYLYPAGFREGLAISLFSADGRYLGVLNTSSADPRPASDAACAVLAQMAPFVASAVDPMRSVSAVADLVAGAAAGVVLTRAGGAVPLPGLPGHRLLAPGSALLAAAHSRLTGDSVQTSFLCPADGDTEPSWLLVRALRCPSQPPWYLSTAVLLCPPPDLRGLTRRELEVLGLLIEGWSNARIADGLSLSLRTVVTHMEHIMTKFDAASRTMAAIRASRQGLYVPPELSLTAAPDVER